MVNMIYIIYLIVFFLICAVKGSELDLYDKNQLNKIDSIKRFLLNKGFLPKLFLTKDGYWVQGLFLERQNATSSIIICPGLMCAKESMATFYSLLPEHYNIIFFDPRGHGKSSGSLFYKPWLYGMSEYYDIVSILDFLREKTSVPVIVYGNCAGAFNAAHALILLSDLQMLQNYRIKGFIFDSGWASVTEASRTVMNAKLQRIINKCFQKIAGARVIDFIGDTSVTLFLKHCMKYFLRVLHTFCCKPLLQPYEKHTNLYDKIHKIPIPILFIHSYDDSWVDVEHVKKLMSLVDFPFVWFIDKPSFHSSHHLVHPNEFRDKLVQFCNQVLSE